MYCVYGNSSLYISTEIRYTEEVHYWEGPLSEVPLYTQSSLECKCNYRRGSLLHESFSQCAIGDFAACTFSQLNTNEQSIAPTLYIPLSIYSQREVMYVKHNNYHKACGAGMQSSGKLFWACYVAFISRAYCTDSII